MSLYLSPQTSILHNVAVSGPRLVPDRTGRPYGQYFYLLTKIAASPNQCCSHMCSSQKQPQWFTTAKARHEKQYTFQTPPVGHMENAYVCLCFNTASPTQCSSNTCSTHKQLRCLTTAKARQDKQYTSLYKVSCLPSKSMMVVLSLCFCIHCKLAEVFT